ncbi:MAG: ABC transporter permease, partial [Gemmatimonadota bacterium]|nr:ABC transporter permease [Gemmatimonadota bacterium]
MLVGETVQVAIQAIIANKLRSILTMLGIVIGVAAVITMVALGTGAQKAVEEQIQALGTDLLSVYPGQSFTRGVASQDRVSLTTDDSEALARDGYALKEVVPEISRNQQVKFGNQNINVNVLASTPNYVEVQNYEVEAGRMFTQADNNSRRRVAALGFGVPNMLGTNGAAMIGQQVSIRGIPFEIVAILSEKGGSGFSNP